MGELLQLAAEIARGDYHPSHCVEDYRKGTGRAEFAREAGECADRLRGRVRVLRDADTRIATLEREAAALRKGQPHWSPDEQRCTIREIAYRPEAELDEARMFMHKAEDHAERLEKEAAALREERDNFQIAVDIMNSQSPVVEAKRLREERDELERSQWWLRPVPEEGCEGTTWHEHAETLQEDLGRTCADTLKLRQERDDTETLRQGFATRNVALAAESAKLRAALEEAEWICDSMDMLRPTCEARATHFATEFANDKLLRIAAAVRAALHPPAPADPRKCGCFTWACVDGPISLDEHHPHCKHFAPAPAAGEPTELERLRAFAGDMIESSWGGPDDEDVWTAGEKHGLFVKIPGGFDPEKHHDHSGCAEPGDDFYRLAWEPEAAAGEEG